MDGDGTDGGSDLLVGLVEAFKKTFPIREAVERRGGVATVVPTPEYHGQMMFEVEAFDMGRVWEIRTLYRDEIGGRVGERTQTLTLAQFQQLARAIRRAGIV